MPSPGDGVVLAQWIGEHYPDTKVILTSGVNASLEAAQTACKSIAGILPKPYQYEAVLGQVRTALASRASN
jgi:DNA-binding NtrC family response regulator